MNRPHAITILNKNPKLIHTEIKFDSTFGVYRVIVKIKNKNERGKNGTS